MVQAVAAVVMEVVDVVVGAIRLKLDLAVLHLDAATVFIYS